MHRDFIQVSPDEDLAEVVRLMTMARVRTLPVLERGELTGMVSHRELARAALALASGAGGVIHGSIAPFVHEAARVSPEATLSEAARHMLGQEVPCLAAVEPEDGPAHMVGLLTETDLLRAAYQRSETERSEPEAARASRP